MDINLEYYKIFYYTAKQKSVTLAAEKLSISQPAVSQAIKHLEKDLGCALFVRTAKGVRLTKEGEMLFPMWNAAVRRFFPEKKDFLRC